MNQSSPQGQQGQNNPQAAQMAAAAAAQRMTQPAPFYKPEQMRNISILNEEEKTKYERGLAHLWRTHDTTPAGSPENNEAKKKILEFGKMLTSKIQARRLQIQQQQQQAQAQLQQRQAGGQQAQANPAPQTQAGAALKAAQSPGTGAPATSANVAPATTAAMAGNTATTNPAAGAAQAPPPQQQQQQQLKIPEHLASHVNQVDFNAITPPAQVQDKAKWAMDLKTRYTRCLLTMESTRVNVQKIDIQIRERTEKGNPLSAEEQKNVADKKAQLQKVYNDSMKFVSDIRKQLGIAQQHKQQANGAQVAQAGAGAAAQSNPMQNSTAAVSAAIEAAKNQQLAAAGRLPGQQQGGQPTQAPPANTQAQSPALAQGAPSSATHQTAGPHPQQQQAPPPPQQQQQRPIIKTEPGTQPPSNPIPAPLNTAIASSAAAAGLPSAGTPTQNSARVQTPQSSTPTNGAPRALSHTAALSIANNRNSISAQGQQGSAPGPGSGPPSVPGMLGAGQQGHGHAHPPQPTGQTLQSKLPIPKVLPEKATQGPTPVSMSYSRPTYSGGSGLGGGVMGQPALAKTPVYQLEGEGERVLNKKKLDELVRQVCGGTAEGQEGNLLTPEVEESVLNLADSFVDNVLHTACRNAKERGSRVLEIRDIQLVLERTYNIRIPGYSSEELRTVRKIQPSPAWITKMSAVQAAKVMPGKGDL